MTMTVLVTGGAGYIGSHTVKELRKNNFNVVVYDNLSTGHKEAVLGATLVVADLNDKAKLEETLIKYKITAVVHFAGSIIVPESVENPIKYYLNNTVNSANLLDLCQKHKINNFIFSSTASLYGMLDKSPLDEDFDLKPINPYAESKLMTEKMLRDLSSANNKFKYVALRYFNVSGADPDGELGQAFIGATHLIKVNCEAAAGKRDKTYIFGTDYPTIDGTGVRDYIHVTDLAAAHVSALKYLLNGGDSLVANCGYGQGTTVKEIIAAVKTVTKKDYPVEIAPRRAGDPATLVSKVEKIHKYLDWKPKYNDLNFIIKTAYDWEKSETLKKWTQK